MFNSHAQAEVQTVEWLSNEISRRRNRQSAIRTAMCDLALRHRGVERFPEKIEAWMPSGNQLHLCMGRQVATVSVEQMCLQILGEQWMEIDNVPKVIPEVIEFKRDNLPINKVNGYKKSLVDLPIIQSIKNGMVSVRRMKVVPPDKRGMLGRGPQFASIPAQLRNNKMNVDFAGNVPDLHRELRIATGTTNGTTYDVSSLWEECVRESLKPPASVYVEKNGGTARMGNECILTEQRYVRPPASWYYLLYLSLFLDGSRALLATTIEEDDENIRSFFLNCMKILEEETGFSPLILWLPHSSPYLRDRQTGKPCDYTEMNPAFFHANWRDGIAIPQLNTTIYEAGNNLLHQLLTLSHE